MNNAEIIKGIERTIEGLNTIKGALLASDEKVAEKKEVKKETKKAEPKVEETAETAETVATDKTYTMAELNSMKYNEFKKLASTLGVKCTGTRKQILDRIIELGVVAEESEAEPVEEEAPVEEKKEPKKSADTKAGKKLGKKKADEEEAEPEEDEFDEQAKEIADETPVEDIIEALADVDIKANKKNAVKKLAEALRKGLIELDEDGEEEAGAEDDEDTPEEASVDSIEPDSYFPEYDFYGVNDPEEMTEERASAIQEKMEEIISSYPDDLTEEDVQSYLEDNATEEQLEALGEDYEDLDLLKMYMELVKCTIDNDGDEAEQGEPYEIGEKNFCCGHELKYVKKTKRYVCEHCGEEYEA